jgi:hypothetical protein
LLVAAVVERVVLARLGEQAAAVELAAVLAETVHLHQVLLVVLSGKTVIALPELLVGLQVAELLPIMITIVALLGAELAAVVFFRATLTQAQTVAT